MFESIFSDRGQGGKVNGKNAAEARFEPSNLGFVGGHAYHLATPLCWRLAKTYGTVAWTGGFGGSVLCHFSMSARYRWVIFGRAGEFYRCALSKELNIFPNFASWKPGCALSTGARYLWGNTVFFSSEFSIRGTSLPPVTWLHKARKMSGKFAYLVMEKSGKYQGNQKSRSCNNPVLRYLRAFFVRG